MSKFLFFKEFRCSHEIGMWCQFRLFILKVSPLDQRFLSFSLLFSLLVAHASSLVLGSEVVILVFFTILNDYKYEKTTTNMRQ